VDSRTQHIKLCSLNAFCFVTGVLDVRVSRVSLDQIARKVRAVNQEGICVKTERHAGKIAITVRLLFVAVRRP
jgi:hypothetical protein